MRGTGGSSSDHRQQGYHCRDPLRRRTASIHPVPQVTDDSGAVVRAELIDKTARRTTAQLPAPIKKRSTAMVGVVLCAPVSPHRWPLRAPSTPRSSGAACPSGQSRRVLKLCFAGCLAIDEQEPCCIPVSRFGTKACKPCRGEPAPCRCDCALFERFRIQKMVLRRRPYWLWVIRGQGPIPDTFRPLFRRHIFEPTELVANHLKNKLYLIKLIPVARSQQVYQAPNRTGIKKGSAQIYRDCAQHQS